MLNAKKVPNTGGSSLPEQPVLEPGAYPARVVQVIGLGLQKQDPFKGEPKPPAYKIRVTYELSDEFCVGEDGEVLEDKPRWQSEEFALYSLDSDLATSTKRYLSIDNKNEFEGDWSRLVGMPVTVTLGTYFSKKAQVDRNKVLSTSPMREKEAAKLPELVNSPAVFDTDSPDMEVFFSLPSFLQKQIKSNLEYGGSALEKLVEAGPPSSEGGDTKKEEKAPQKASEEASADEDW